MASLTKSDLREIIEETVSERIDMLENEISNMKKTMTAQYLNSIGKVLEREAKETMSSFSCAYHGATEVACKGMLNKYISKYTYALSMGDLAEAFSVLHEFEEAAEKNIEDLDKEQHCRKDWQHIRKILLRHKDIAKDLSAQFTTKRVPADIGELDFSPQELYDDVVFPLSHTLRIKIIHVLKSGAKRFTVLKDNLGVKNTGLLVHHLKPLTEAGLVEQDYKKAYSLTDTGYTVARYLSQIAAAIKPQEIATVTLGSQPQITKLPMVD